MNKRRIFTLLPAILCFGVLSGCKGGGDTPTPTPTPEKTLTSITVTPTTKTYSVGMQFTKESIGSFQANYSDGSTVSIKEGYTCNPTLPYTFVEDDVANGKDFNFTYQEKTASFHIKVINPTYPIDFDFRTGDSEIELDLNSNREIQIAFKSSTYEQNYNSIEWNVETGSESYISIIESKGKICRLKATAKTLKNSSALLNVSVTNKIGKKLENTCKINVIEPKDNDPKTLIYYDKWYSYLREDKFSSGSTFTFNVTKDSSHAIRYFGMSNYAGDTPYFTFDNDSGSKDISITKISYTPSGGTLKELTYNTDWYIYTYSGNDFIVFKNMTISTNDKISVECKLNKQLDNGLWAYFGY